MNYSTIISGDLWVMEPAALERLATQLSAAIDMSAVAAGKPGDGTDEPGYDVKDGIAHIGVRGVLMKEVPRVFKYLGIEATGYGNVSRAMDDAESDPNVTAIMLDVDSPGGSSGGIHAMADRIASSKKFVSAHIDTIGASGAYWMASQAKKVTAGRGAQVGSIGAYTARVDMSRAAENAGIKVHLFSSGPHKGAGYPGTSLTAEQKDEIQANIDALAAEFVADVARGRGASATDIQASADGRVFSAADAKQRFLIDSITSDPAKDYHMAKDMAAQQAYSKQIVALCAEFPKHSSMIQGAFDKETAIEQIRGDIAVAEKSAQEAAAKVELESKVASVTALLDVEKSDHAATKAKLANVERERDALAVLSKGAEGAKSVKSEPAPKSVKKITQAQYDALPTAEQAAACRGMAAGDLLVEG